jgi:hypothetical protein
MELRLSYASMEKISEAIGKLQEQLERGEEAELSMPLEGAGGDEDLRITFIDEASEEFAEPSASVSR